MIRFVLLIAFAACANRANTAQGHATDCTTEEIAALAARDASSAYQNLKEAGVVADTFADSIAMAVVDSVAYATYDSLFASLHTTFGPEAAAAFDQYMDAKQAFYTVGTPIDETALSGAFAVGKYLFNAAGVMHRLTAAEIAIWGNEYYPAWDRFNAAGKEVTKQAAAAAHRLTALSTTTPFCLWMHQTLPLDTGLLSWPSLMRISKCVPQCRPRNFSASRTG